MIAVSVTLAACTKGSSSDVPEITLGAAASMRLVLPDLAQAYAKRAKVTATFGATGDVARQVHAGAPLDGVLLASAAAVDDLVAKERVHPASRVVVATNTLVLVGRTGSARQSFASLGSLLPGESIAMGDPRTVPAGAYAKDALTRLGSWEALRDRVLFASDVGAVMTYVKHGEASLGIVYATEARSVDGVVVHDVARGAWAPRPEVVAGVVVGAPQGDAALAFVKWLGSSEARAIFAARGFGPP